MARWNKGRLERSNGQRSAVSEGVARRARSNYWPWSVVGLVVAWNLWDLRATVRPVSYLDDASVHEQMVRYAPTAIASGHDPLTEWFPYLGAGSPQFLHYQSLGAIVTGFGGT